MADQIGKATPGKVTRELRAALKVIAEATREPAGGSYWPARKYLDKRGVFNDDLQDYRVIHAVAAHALKTRSRKLKG